MQADFTAGGAYVGLKKSLESLAVRRVTAIRFRAKTDNTQKFGLRLVDSTGQCHQRKGLVVEADGKWHDIELLPEKVAGGEHWGGANDGKFHGSVKLMELMLNPDSATDKQPKLLISHVTAEVVVEATSAAPAFIVDIDNWRSGRVGSSRAKWARITRGMATLSSNVPRMKRSKRHPPSVRPLRSRPAVGKRRCTAVPICTRPTILITRPRRWNSLMPRAR